MCVLHWGMCTLNRRKGNCVSKSTIICEPLYHEFSKGKKDEPWTAADFNECFVRNQDIFCIFAIYLLVNTHNFVHSTVAATPGQFSSPYKVYHSVQLGSVYTKRQRQRCDNSAMMLQNGFATHFQASPLISMRTESLASSQSGRSVDADAWCKRSVHTVYVSVQMVRMWCIFVWDVRHHIWIGWIPILCDRCCSSWKKSQSHIASCERP